MHSFIPHAIMFLRMIDQTQQLLPRRSLMIFPTKWTLVVLMRFIGQYLAMPMHIFLERLRNMHDETMSETARIRMRCSGHMMAFHILLQDMQRSCSCRLLDVPKYGDRILWRGRHERMRSHARWRLGMPWLGMKRRQQSTRREMIHYKHKYSYHPQNTGSRVGYG